MNESFLAMTRHLLVLPLLLCFAISDLTAQIHVGQGQPYPDIGAAAHARVVRAGDTIFVHAGTYTNSMYWIDSLIGTPDRWITIVPFGTDSVSIHEQYTFQTAQYVRIARLNFFGDDSTQRSRVFHQLFFDYEYACFTANHDIIVEDCTFTNLNNTGKESTGACIKFTGTDNFLVQRCTFRDGTNITDGISLNADRNGVIRHCTFRNMPGDASHCKGGTKNVTYEQNLFVNCAAGGLDVGGDTGPQFFCPLGAAWEADSIKVYANIFIGGSTGIKLSSCHNSFIYNNTCFKSTTFAFRSLNASSNNITLDNNYIYNNIFTTYSPNHIYLNASSNFTFNTEYFKNNLFHDYLHADPDSINWSELPGVNATGSIIGDPLFTDTAHGDLSLRVGSPAIGTGVALSEPTADYRNMPYSLSARSIGAFESQQASVPSVRSNHELLLAPNPCGDEVTLFLGSGTRPADIIVLDMLGREVLRVAANESIEPRTLSVDVSSAADGEYMLITRGSTGELVGRCGFVKRR